MPCNSPVRGRRQSDGSIKWRLGAHEVGNVQVACGWCMGCRVRRTRDWATRMMHEAQLHKVNSFITLTYDEEHLPEDRSLEVSHWQGFMKRLRANRAYAARKQKRKPEPIRFYHCGEYGPKTLRPHYHAALFNCDFPDQVKVDGGSKSGEDMWSSAELVETWGHGIATVQPLTFETASYVAGYIINKVQGKEATKRATERVDPITGEVWHVRPEYSTMSRGGRGSNGVQLGGIGRQWLSKFKDDVYPHDHVVRSGGVKLPPPKYYDKLIPEEELEALQKRREERARRRRLDHDTPYKRDAREKILRAQIGLRTRGDLATNKEGMQ